MTDRDISRNIRRQSRKGPSPLRHGIMAIIIILCAIASAYMLVGMLKTHSQTKPVTKVAITVPDPIADPAANLADERLRTTLGENDLPDLIAPDIDNPTEILVGGTETQDDAQDDAQDATDDTPDSSPVIPRINGQPAGRKPATPLIKAPIQGLSRQSAYGLVPAKNSQGDSAFELYAKPFTAPKHAKTAAIIVGGLGLNSRVTNRAILELPEHVTLSFAAHSPQLQTYIDLARENGHEVIIEVPMQSQGEQPSKTSRSLKITDDPAENIRNIEWLLSRAAGYFAVMNYNGDQFLKRSDHVAPILDSLNKAGLGFVFDTSFQAISLPALATSAKLPFTEGTMVLDEINSEALIRANLSELGNKALAGQHAIGIGFAYPATIKAISQWAIDAPNNGIVLVPASYLMRQ